MDIFAEFALRVRQLCLHAREHLILRRWPAGPRRDDPCPAHLIDIAPEPRRLLRRLLESDGAVVRSFENGAAEPGARQRGHERGQRRVRGPILPPRLVVVSSFPGSMPYARRISTSSGVCPADEPGRRGGTRQSDESSFQPNERCAARTTATFGGVSVSSSSSDVASSSELSDTSSTTARRRRLPRVLGKPHLSARLIPSLWRTTVTSGGKGRLGPSRLARFGTRTSSGMGSQSITRVDLV